MAWSIHTTCLQRTTCPRRLQRCGQHLDFCRVAWNLQGPTDDPTIAANFQANVQLTWSSHRKRCTNHRVLPKLCKSPTRRYSARQFYTTWHQDNKQRTLLVASLPLAWLHPQRNHLQYGHSATSLAPRPALRIYTEAATATQTPTTRSWTAIIDLGRWGVARSFPYSWCWESATHGSSYLNCVHRVRWLYCRRVKCDLCPGLHYMLRSTNPVARWANQTAAS